MDFKVIKIFEIAKSLFLSSDSNPEKVQITLKQIVFTVGQNNY